MHIDFSSAIDNARLIAARDEALRRNAAHTVAVQLKRSQWSALPDRGGSPEPARARGSAAPFPKAGPSSHAR